MLAAAAAPACRASGTWRRPRNSTLKEGCRGGSAWILIWLRRGRSRPSMPRHYLRRSSMFIASRLSGGFFCRGSRDRRGRSRHCSRMRLRRPSIAPTPLRKADHERLPATMTCVEVREKALKPVPTTPSHAAAQGRRDPGQGRRDGCQSAGHCPAAGFYPPPPERPTCLASKPPGTVAALVTASPAGSWAMRSAPGPRRFLCRVLHRTGTTMPLPRRKGYDMRAALPENFISPSGTICSNERGRLSAGENVLIHGACERHRHDGDPATKRSTPRSSRRYALPRRPRPCRPRRRSCGSSPRTNDWAGRDQEAVGRCRCRARHGGGRLFA